METLMVIRVGVLALLCAAQATSVQIAPARPEPPAFVAYYWKARPGNGPAVAGILREFP